MFKNFTLAFFALALATVPLFAAAVCPTTINTNTDCGYILTIGSGALVTGAAVIGANPYDGADDALVGVINNSGAVYNGSITLSGSGNGGGLFGFDGDGICNYTAAAYCATAATGYEGPSNIFTNILTKSVFEDTGTIVFAGLANGASTYFSLEGSPASINVMVTPEPGTVYLLGAGLAACFVALQRRKSPSSS